jgi:hypothetical protein
VRRKQYDHKDRDWRDTDTSQGTIETTEVGRNKEWIVS